MFTRKIMAIFLLIVINSTFACSNDNIKENNKIEVESNEVDKLSLDDRRLIDEYNGISDSLINDSSKFKQQLILFLPKAFKIKNRNERNNILMNIYTQTEQYEEAYKLNETLIKENPTTANIAFRCQILELLDKDLNIKKQCYETSAKSIKKELSSISERDPMYNYAEFVYFLEMYRAGHVEYKEKMKTALSLIEDESSKMNANIWYEDAVSKDN